MTRHEFWEMKRKEAQDDSFEHHLGPIEQMAKARAEMTHDKAQS